MSNFNEIIKALSQLFHWWILVMPWEQGLRIRLGKNVKVLVGGIYLRIPFVDIAYVKAFRVRIIPIAPQTVTTADRQTVTVTCALGYEIVDILKLYNSLNDPEMTLSTIAACHVATKLMTSTAGGLTSADIESYLMDEMGKTDYGLKFSYLKITSFAIVRTYRLIQDGNWHHNALNLIEKS